MSDTIYSNKCQYCSKFIPDKTKANKPRKFCDKSCSRRWVCENKKEVVIEANKRGYQTLLQREDAEDFLKHRGRKTEKKAAKLQEMVADGHFHRMSMAVQSPKTSPEAQEKRRRSMIDSGLWVDYDNIDLDDYQNYQRLVRHMTKHLYGTGKDGHEIDHIVPVMKGYEMGIEPEKMWSKENIQLIPMVENRSKGVKLTDDALMLLDVWGGA